MIKRICPKCEKLLNMDEDLENFCSICKITWWEDKNGEKKTKL